MAPGCSSVLQSYQVTKETIQPVLVLKCHTSYVAVYEVIPKRKIKVQKEYGKSRCDLKFFFHAQNYCLQTS
jgi:hypothetical protein